MGNNRHKPALKLFALLCLGSLLPGCTTLTDDLADPSESLQQTAPLPVQPEVASEWESIQYVDVATGEPLLKPGDGEEEVFRMIGTGSARGGTRGAEAAGNALDQGETIVYWTCRGTGPISITLTDGTGFASACEDLEPDQVSRNSYASEAREELHVSVEAGPEATWQVLVTQAAV